MKTFSLSFLRSAACGIGLSLGGLGVVRAQYSWSADFNDREVPEGMTLRGDATVSNTRGIGGGGCLQLTPSMPGTQGDAILPHFMEAGDTPADVTIRFSVKLNGNTSGVMGDGFSFTVSDGVPSVPVDEKGIGMGPKVCFDTFDNDGTDGGLTLWWPDRRSRYATAGPPNRLATLLTDREDWHSMEIKTQLYSRASSVKFDGDQLVSVPASDSVTPLRYEQGRLVFGARTGDAFNAHLIDNINVSVTPYPIFREAPSSLKVTSGSTVAFTAQTNFNTLPWQGLGTFLLAQSASTEWQIRHPGGAWTAVPDTLTPVLWGPEARPRVIFHQVRESAGLWEGDDPAWSIDGTEVRCVLSWNNGYTAVSGTAVLNVMPRPEELPGAVTLFNSFPLGNASVAFEESGKILRLTPAAVDQAGGFVFDEISHDNNLRPQRVTGFAGTFLFRGSEASDPAADGISFNLGNLPAGVPVGAGEEGVGDGLTISLDAYENGPDDPTGVDVVWKGVRLARIPMAAAELFPDNNWRELYVRISQDGRVDVALDGVAVLSGLELPGWVGLEAPKMGIYGRTGSLWQRQEVMMGAVAVTAVPILGVKPELTIARLAGGGGMRLEWVDPAGAGGTGGAGVGFGWVLFESPDLKNWTRSGRTVFEEGAGRSVMVMPEGGARFFRLQKD
ncbi:MAG: hypothetical protein JWL81_1099 [Verrucomicrobiales bacterium]|nr:hypothetical protein [Verrucomicrobiales bacterium]